jgi:hypothetical protein
MEKGTEFPIDEKHADVVVPRIEHRRRTAGRDLGRLAVAFLFISCLWLAHVKGFLYSRSHGCHGRQSELARAQTILKENPLIGWSH